MLTFADKGGRGDLANTDITDKNALKRANKIILTKFFLKYWLFRTYCNFFCHSGRGGRDNVNKADKARGGGGGGGGKF